MKILNVAYYKLLSKYNCDIFHPVVFFMHSIIELAKSTNNNNMDGVSNILDEIGYYMKIYTGNVPDSVPDVLLCWDLCKTIVMPKVWHKSGIKTKLTRQ